MRAISRCAYRTFWIFLLACVLAPRAHAYLDAGSGSMMLQLLLAGVAGAALALKMFWRRVLAFFGLVKDASPKDRKPS